MKILHVITSLEVGGAQKLLTELLPLQANSENVTLLVYKRVYNDFEKAVEQNSIRIISLEENNFYNPKVIIRMRKIFKDYDIVHAHLFPTLYWASLAARGLKTKLIYTEHSTFNSRRNKWYFKPIERFMYKKYDKIISISRQTQEALTLWLGENDERFIIIENGVDTKKFSLIKSPVIPESLIMVSRFATSKDQETVIKAMKYINKKAKLRLVGDGENRINCEKIAKELGLSDRIQFMGARSDIAELISSSYIGIQSSKWEGFGLTAVEIMSCGKPVVASDVEGLKQVVEGAGLIFKCGNVIELADIINNLLNDKEYYNKISDKCLQRAQKYDISVMSQKYLSVYK